MPDSEIKDSSPKAGAQTVPSNPPAPAEPAQAKVEDSVQAAGGTSGGGGGNQAGAANPPETPPAGPPDPPASTKPRPRTGGEEGPRPRSKVFEEAARLASEEGAAGPTAGDPTIELLPDAGDAVELLSETVRGWVELLERNRLLVLTSWDTELLRAAADRVARVGWREPGQRRLLPVGEDEAACSLADLAALSPGGEERLVVVFVEDPGNLAALGLGKSTWKQVQLSLERQLAASGLAVLIVCPSAIWRGAQSRLRLDSLAGHTQSLDFVLPRLRRAAGEDAAGLAARIERQRKLDLWPEDESSFWSEFKKASGDLRGAVAERDAAMSDSALAEEFRHSGQGGNAAEALKAASVVERALIWIGAFLPSLPPEHAEDILHRIVAGYGLPAEEEAKLWTAWNDNPDQVRNRCGLEVRPDELYGAVYSFGSREGAVKRHWRDALPTEHSHMFQRAERLNLLLDGRRVVRQRARALLSERASRESRGYGAEVLVRNLAIMAGAEEGARKIDDLLGDLPSDRRRDALRAASSLLRTLMVEDELVRVALGRLASAGGAATALDLLSRGKSREMTPDSFVAVLRDILTHGSAGLCQPAAALLFDWLGGADERAGEGLAQKLQAALPATAGGNVLFHLVLRHLEARSSPAKDPLLRWMRSREESAGDALDCLARWLGQKEVEEAAARTPSKVLDPDPFGNTDIFTFWLLPGRDLAELYPEADFYGQAQLAGRLAVLEAIAGGAGGVEVAPADLLRAACLSAWLMLASEPGEGGTLWRPPVEAACGGRRNNCLLALNALERGLMAATDCRPAGRSRIAFAQRFSVEEKVRRRWSRLLDAVAGVRLALVGGGTGRG